MKTCKIVSLFNHKGGVSKTTTTFHMGWMMAEMGLKVLMVDIDPQCNLTGSSLEGKGDLFNEESNILQNFYEKKDNNDIYNAIEPVIRGKNIIIEPIKPANTNHKNLKLIAGNIKLADIEIPLAVGMASNSYLPFATQFIGSINALIRTTAQRYGVDVVLIDMSPSIGALNQCVFMGSDYFIVPVSPDYFCHQAIHSISTFLPKWHEQFKAFRKHDIPNPLPEHSPKFLGVVSQRYRKYTTATDETTRAYQKWIDNIQNAVNNILVPQLQKVDMAVKEEYFKKCVREEKPYNLINISEFNTLIPKAQTYHKPVYELTSEELNLSGDPLSTSIENQKTFKEKFEQLASSVLCMIDVNVPATDFDKSIDKVM